MNDLVSIITPSYNSEKFISQTIESILTQSYQNWEMIIVDDGSTDSSKDIITTYCQQDKRIKLLTSTKQCGAAIARNLAIKAAKGRYIAFLDSDDMWLPEKLSKQITFMQSKQLAFTYASYRLINENGHDLGLFITKPKIDYNSLLKTCSVGCLTAIYDSKKLGKLYMPNIKKQQDYGLWLNILKRIKYTHGIQEPLAIYRISKESISSNKLSVSRYQWTIYRKIEKLTLAQSCYYFIHYVYNGLIKYRGIKQSK